MQKAPKRFIFRLPKIEPITNVQGSWSYTPHIFQGPANIQAASPINVAAVSS